MLKSSFTIKFSLQKSHHGYDFTIVTKVFLGVCFICDSKTIWTKGNRQQNIQLESVEFGLIARDTRGAVSSVAWDFVAVHGAENVPARE